MILPAPLSMDTDTNSAVGWINLTTLLLRRFASFGRAALQASVTRRATLYGFHPQEVSFWLADDSSPRRGAGGIDRGGKWGDDPGENDDEPL